MLVRPRPARAPSGYLERACGPSSSTPSVAIVLGIVYAITSMYTHGRRQGLWEGRCQQSSLDTGGSRNPPGPVTLDTLRCGYGGDLSVVVPRRHTVLVLLGLMITSYLRCVFTEPGVAVSRRRGRCRLRRGTWSWRCFGLGVQSCYILSQVSTLRRPRTIAPYAGAAC